MLTPIVLIACSLKIAAAVLLPIAFFLVASIVIGNIRWMARERGFKRDAARHRARVLLQVR